MREFKWRITETDWLKSYIKMSLKNWSFLKLNICIYYIIQGTRVSRVIMSPTELKMQPTIHLQS
jgi:hypothetical protein